MWNALIRKLEIHLAIVQSQTKNLQEDRDTDQEDLDTPKDAEVVEPLTTYIAYV